MSSPKFSVPESLNDWRKLVASKSGLQKTTLHDEQLASASKIGVKQFLLLRVIWNIHRTPQIVKLSDMQGWIEEAEKKLRSYQSWSTYCESIDLREERSSKERLGEPSKTTPEGNFAIARHYQLEVVKAESEVNPEAFDTPIAARTHAKTDPSLAKGMGRLRLDPFETQTKKKSNSSPSRRLLLLDDESPSPSSSSSSDPSPSPGPSPPNTLSRELDKILYPPDKGRTDCEHSTDSIFQCPDHPL